MSKKTNTKSGAVKAVENSIRTPLPSELKKANPAKAPATQVPTAAPHSEVTFALYEPNAQEVFVSGVFNGWSPNATPLQKRPNRDWHAKVALPPGRHEYKFVVDGKWKIDPRASQSAPNQLGTLNSVIEVKA